jgi:hypothetical protein
MKTWIRVRIETNEKSDPGSGSTLKPMQDHYSGAGITGFEHFHPTKNASYFFGKIYVFFKRPMLSRQVV